MRRLALAFLLLFGCSSESSSPAPTDAGKDTSAADARAACVPFAAALCTRFAACSDFVIGASFGDEAGCRASIEQRCKGVIGLPGVVYGAAELATCTKNVPTSTCESLFGGAVFDLCSLPAGTLDDGKRCFDAAQCKSGVCRQPAGEECGVCARAPAAGEPCADGSCSAALTCVSGKCLERAQPGKPCVESRQCPLAYSCVDGSCVASLTEGAACDPTGKTGNSCSLKDGLFCLGVPPAGSCTKIGLADAGKACGQASPTTFTLCKASGNCKGSPTGVCEVAPGPGEPCAATGNLCAVAARCIGGVCRIPDPTVCN